MLDYKIFLLGSQASIKARQLLRLIIQLFMSRISPVSISIVYLKAR